MSLRATSLLLPQNLPRKLETRKRVGSKYSPPELTATFYPLGGGATGPYLHSPALTCHAKKLVRNPSTLLTNSDGHQELGRSHVAPTCGYKHQLVVDIW